MASTATAVEPATMLTVEPTGSCKRLRASNHNDVFPASKRLRLANTTTATTKSSSKRVRFAMDSNNNNNSKDNFAVKEDIYYFDRVEAHDIPNVWWTKTEMKESRHCDFYWIHSYHQCEAYGKDLLQLLEVACDKSDSTCTSTSTTSAAASIASSNIANSPIRGLEHDMSPCFSQRRKHVIANVLKSQQSLQVWWKRRQQPNKKDSSTSSTSSSAFVAKALASHYQKLAQPAKRLAHLLAVGDETARW